MTVEFGVLGEVEARWEGRLLVLGSARPRSVLAALLLDANKVLALDELVTRVWGHDPPQQARGSLHSYFTRLRSALRGESTIVRSGHGYLLRTDPAGIDLIRFRDAVAEARSSSCRADALIHLTSALELWRGTPFAGLDSPWLTDVRTALQAERAAVELDHNDARLELGEHTGLLPELARQAGQEPLNERLSAQYMLALYRCGRQSDALLHYQRVKSALAEQLGIDPNATLRALYQSILQEDAALAVAARPVGDPVTTVTPASPAATAVERAPGRPAAADQPPLVPRQLPSAPAWFIGRGGELAALSAMLQPDLRSGGTGVALIAGSGGMGKTWLALHWAHRNAGSFPDGQLFLNLRGFDTELDRVVPTQAMRTLLTAFALEPHTIPDDPEALAGLYRSVLADKRVLLVLDNAQDADQITALIPSGPHCAVLVTSRNRLTSLVTRHSAGLLALDVLSPGDAHTLLTSRLGAHRAAAEATALQELAEVCGGLPLALSITVSRAREHPEFPMSGLVAELHEAGSALSALEADAELSVRAVLSTSYAALSAEQARGFQLLGLVPGPDISLSAAGALTGSPHATTRVLLRELEGASLIQQHTPGRYRMHDLVRLYARERADHDLDDAAREAVLYRFAVYHVHALRHATGVVDPGRPTAVFGDPPDGCALPRLLSKREAWQWFETEELNLHAVHRMAQQHGWHEVVWQLPAGFVTFYGHSGRTHDMFDNWRAALAAAEALGDPARLSMAHRMVARCNVRLGRMAEAVQHADASLATAEQADSPVEQILALMARIEIHFGAYRTDLAMLDGERAWRLAQDQDAPIRRRVACDFAWTLALAGQYDRSREIATIALELFGQDDDRCSVLDTLGYVARRTGHLEQAVDHLLAAQECCPPSNGFAIADISCTLGETYFELGRPREAEEHLRRARDLFQEQHRLPDVQRAEASLDRLVQAEVNP